MALGNSSWLRGGSNDEAKADISEEKHSDTDHSVVRAEYETLGLRPVGNEMISPAAYIENYMFRHPQVEGPPTSQDSLAPYFGLVQSPNSKNGYSSISEISHIMENFERQGSTSAVAVATGPERSRTSSLMPWS